MKTCKICKQKFGRPECYSDKQWGKRRYCSAPCAKKDFSKIRLSQWGKPEYREMMSKAHLGQTAWNKGVSLVHKRGEGSASWRGSSAQYSPKHAWVKKYKPKPDGCEFCGEDKKLELSNKDHKYSRDINDYQYLCRPCHVAYDKKLKTKKKNNEKRDKNG